MYKDTFIQSALDVKANTDSSQQRQRVIEAEVYPIIEASIKKVKGLALSEFGSRICCTTREKRY